MHMYVYMEPGKTWSRSTAEVGTAKACRKFSQPQMIKS